MKTHAVIRGLGLGLLVAGIGLGLQALTEDTKAAAPKKSSPIKVGPYTLSGPYTHENLTIFLIHGPDQLKGKNFLTLQEALEQKKVIVHETKNVNQLSVENVSPDVEVFIQSGDIVKGGQQDRTIAYDIILPPKSGKMPIAAFCVEHGRWRQRGRESVAQFDSSYNTLPSKDAKIAVKGGGSSGGRGRSAGGARIAAAQSAVWKDVARKQMMLSRALGKSVKSAQSDSSLQLTLEDKKLLKTVDNYTGKMKSLLEGKKDVIGYAFAINGQINSADIYASKILFKKLWPKLLAATVVESISEVQKGKKFEQVKAEAFKTFMQEADKGKASNQDITKRIRMVTREDKKNILFVTQDQQNKGAVLRKNYIKK